ncbi:MAG: hypothetical protein HOP35_08470 [Nitrospira sp.]|nr:hypothetical protein [Nitrospira sp.]
MGPDEGTLTVQRWDISLRKQGVRLRWLQDYVFGQHHLAVITPDLQERISEVVGYKMDRVQTLHGIGAELFLRVVFPIDETHEDKAGLICMMAGEEKNAFLNMKRILAEIRDLREALDDYRRVVERLVSNEELLSLSASARQQTLIK